MVKGGQEVESEFKASREPTNEKLVKKIERDLGSVDGQRRAETV